MSGANHEIERSLPDRIRSAAYACMAYWFYRWDWGEAIAFDGILGAAQTLEWTAGLDYVDNELGRWIRNFQDAGRRSHVRSAPRPV